MTAKKIVVVGAGVTGLTTALLLSKNAHYKVTIAAKHMPGDYDIEYASPWAGANHLPMRDEGSKDSEWDRKTWKHLEALARHAPESGVHFQRYELHHREKDQDSPNGRRSAGTFAADPWWKNIYSDFSVVPKGKLQLGIDKATAFTSVCINTAIYLSWLESQCLKNGVVFRRAVFKHICDAAAEGVHHSGGHANMVINCTGLSARKLGGVEDTTMFPIRGQTVLVRNEADAMYSISGNDDSSDEMTYIMTRAAGGGTILGGCYQIGNWESQPDPNLAVRIMERAVALCPQLTGGAGIEQLSIIRHGVGLRPGREGGTRIEGERIDGLPVVHSYGHGGGGYQSSYGCAEEVVRLVEEGFGVNKPRL